MRVNEIYVSLSGEGIHAGIPTVFVRTQGCNFRCTYCDTPYALNPNGGEELRATDILRRVNALQSDAKWALITGGEPLIQDDAGELVFVVKSVHKIEVETNGSVNPPTWFKLVDSWNVDVKCPSSGVYGSFRPTWLKKLRRQDQLKFVVGTQEDLNFVRGFLNKSRLRPTVLISPTADTSGEWNRVWLQACAEFCIEQNVRYSLQVQKVIWGNKKGV